MQELNEKRSNNEVEEKQLNKFFDDADNQYCNALEAYDAELRDREEKIETQNKALDEFSSQYSGLMEEYRQRLDEKRKRDKIKEMTEELNAK